MYERILIPLDGSKVGEAALPYVKDLLSKFSPRVKAEITLLQVLSKVAPVFVGGIETAAVVYTPPQIEDTEKKAIAYLTEIGEMLKGKGIKVTTKVAYGNAADGIVQIAEEIDAGLIAMSTHGRSGLSRWAFGSTTDKVLHQGGKIPIVIVKAATDSKKT